MNTVIQLLDASTLPVDAKEELKDLVVRLLADKEIEADAEKDLRHTKSGVNEKQYAKRMAESMSEEKRSEAISIQHAWRSWLANAVFRLHDARTRMSATVKALATRVAELGPQSDRGNLAAVVSVTMLIRENDYSQPDQTLAELDNVNGLDRERLLSAVRAIFESKVSGTGLFATTSYSCSEIEFTNPTPVQVQLSKELARAAVIRQLFEDNWSLYLSVKSKCNYPQFTSRIEELQGRGEYAKVEEVRRSLEVAQARLYAAAVAYATHVPELRAIEGALASAVKAAAASITDRDSLAGHKAMSNCIVGWKWLHELTSYIEDKYRGSNPEAVIAELEPVARQMKQD